MLPPPCFIEEVVCLRSLVVPLFLHNSSFILVHQCKESYPRTPFIVLFSGKVKSGLPGLESFQWFELYFEVSLFTFIKVIPWLWPTCLLKSVYFDIIASVVVCFSYIILALEHLKNGQGGLLIFNFIALF